VQNAKERPVFAEGLRAIRYGAQIGKVVLLERQARPRGGPLRDQTSSIPGEYYRITNVLQVKHCHDQSRKS
jgi:hypothetical protein